MAVIHVGVDYYGHLEQLDGSWLATRFLFISRMPLVPLGTFEIRGGRAGATAFSLKSLLTAYFKAWGFLAAFFSVALGLTWGPWYGHPLRPAAVGVGALLFVAVYASWLFLGRRKRSAVRWGVVVGLAAMTSALIAWGVSMNLDDVARDQARAEGVLMVWPFEGEGECCRQPGHPKAPAWRTRSS